MKSISIILLSAILISGCVMWPSIKSDKDLKPAAEGSNDIYCYKSDHARDCALLTINELSDLLGSIGHTNRAKAYTALGLGTAAASVLTFGGGKHALEGLAIASGTLLGLDTVVNTDTQKEIYEKALKDVTCGLRARDGLLDKKVDFKKATLNLVHQPCYFGG